MARPPPRNRSARTGSIDARGRARRSGCGLRPAPVPRSAIASAARDVLLHEDDARRRSRGWRASPREDLLDELSATGPRTARRAAARGGATTSARAIGEHLPLAAREATRPARRRRRARSGKKRVEFRRSGAPPRGYPRARSPPRCRRLSVDAERPGEDVLGLRHEGEPPANHHVRGRPRDLLVA